MKGYHGKPVLSGNWEEDLDECINIFNNLELMYEVTPQDTTRAVPVMLTGDALNFFANHASSCKTFTEDMDLLRV